MLRSPLALSLAASLLAACGARYTLGDDSAGSSGGGAGASSTSSTATAGGGSGGAAAICPQLVLSGPPISNDPLDGYSRRPALVPATEDGAAVGVVFVQEIDVGGPISPMRIMDASLAPWGAWPSSLGAAHQVCSPSDDRFAAAPVMPGQGPGFSAAFYLPKVQLTGGMYFVPAVSLETDYDPYPEQATWWEFAQTAWAVALAPGESHYLVAYQIGSGAASSQPAFLNLALVDAETLGVALFPLVACADRPFTTAAVAAKGGYLVATASGRAFGACGNDDGVPGPADELQVSRFDEAKEQIDLVASFKEPDPLAHVELAKRKDGAWLVWQNDGASALTPPPIRAVRLDELGAAAMDPFDVTKDGQSSGPFAAAALGPWLAVAWVVANGTGPAIIQLELFDEAGAPVNVTSMGMDPVWLYGDSLSLLPSPDGASLLLAWAQVGPSSPGIVLVARFSCAATQ